MDVDSSTRQMPLSGRSTLVEIVWTGFATPRLLTSSPCGTTTVSRIPNDVASPARGRRVLPSTGTRVPWTGTVTGAFPSLRTSAVMLAVPSSSSTEVTRSSTSVSSSTVTVRVETSLRGNMSA